MVKLDIIVCWPKYLDYPLWRKYISDNRNLFNQIIVVFTEGFTDKVDYRDFLIKASLTDDITFTMSPEVKPNVYGQGDWRNVAVNWGLEVLATMRESEWVYFTEQDFFPINNKFWDEVNSFQKDCDIIAVFEGTRMHPCNIMIKKEVLAKVNRNFSILAERNFDHFGLFQKSIEKLGFKVGRLSPNNYCHMTGLSQNMTLVMMGKQPNYHPEEFWNYINKCMQLGIEINQHFKDTFGAVIAKKTTPPATPPPHIDKD